MMKKSYVRPCVEAEEFLLSQIINGSGDPDASDGSSDGYKPGEDKVTDGDLESNKKGFGSNSIWD